MSIILLLSRSILAAVFGIAGIAKLADPAGSRKSMTDFGAPKFLANSLGWLLPLLELGCAAALVPLSSAWWASVGVLILLVTFIAGISVSLIRGRRPDCHCFGQLHSAPIGWQTLVRNVILAGISALIVFEGQNNPGASIGNWTGGMSRTESALAGLAIAVAALGAFELWALVHVLRQNGRLLLRLDAVEAKLAGGVDAPRLGLPVNEAAPGFNLPDLEGGRITLEMLMEPGNPVLLLFSEPGCDACERALPDVAQWQREYGDRLRIVPITRGDVTAHRAKSEKYNLRNVLLQEDRDVARAYLVDATPSAVLVKNGRIESALAVGPDAIRGLVARATLPPPVKQGDRVPSLRLPDLTGRMIDVAQLEGRILMLFWSSSCGFCQQMLDELKRWERNPPPDAPELVVISASALEDSRKQGFRSRVLLDPYSAAGQVFNSSGTPSAVLIEAGRVASGVAVGASAMLALAGSTRAESAQPV
ncbi:MAG: MauE/DoxX family redox-associated membrane protein [Bryobacteraceae bacterium]|jgi:thiol-disulfide isomerase/thioredoxin/uncharacterized membrane protein YphA (DoxX/SURF4 family)